MLVKVIDVRMGLLHDDTLVEIYVAIRVDGVFVEHDGDPD